MYSPRAHYRGVAERGKARRGQDYIVSGLRQGGMQEPKQKVREGELQATIME